MLAIRSLLNNPKKAMRYGRRAQPPSARSGTPAMMAKEGPIRWRKRPRLQPGSGGPYRTSTPQTPPSLDEPGPECQKSTASRPSPQWARSSRYTGRHHLVTKGGIISVWPGDIVGIRTRLPVQVVLSLSNRPEHLLADRCSYPAIAGAPCRSAPHPRRSTYSRPIGKGRHGQ